MPAATATSWGAAFMASLATALAILLAAIPRIIGFLLILLIGWLIAMALDRLVTAILRRIHFDDLARRSGFSELIHDMGLTTDVSALMGKLVYWFVFIIALVVAFDNLGLTAISVILAAVLFWLPDLAIAILVLILAGIVANAVYRLVRGAMMEAGVGNPELYASIARAAVWVFAVIIAVNEVGIATTLVNTLFIGFVAALALALGLAFGLGGRDTAGQIVREWYSRNRYATTRTSSPPPVAEVREAPEGPSRAA